MHAIRFSGFVLLLIAGVAQLSAQSLKDPPKVVGRVPPPLGSAPAQIQSIVTPPGTICDRAASARARNSSAAPGLETQCNNVKLLIQSNEKADLAPGPSGVPVSVCDAAQSALDRNALEAMDLSAKCRAEGGGQALATPADEYALTGATMGERDPLLTALRQQVDGGGSIGAEIGAAASGHHMLRGFNIGVAVCGNQTEWGPGKQKILDSLPPVEQEGFRVASSFVMDRNRNAKFAAAGASIAQQDPVVARARTANPDARYWLGFDIGSGLFGDPALGGEGHTSTGPGSTAIRNALSAPAQKGFDAAVQFHLNRRR